MKQLICLIAALMALWIVFSFADIVHDNNTVNPSHWRYNAFTVLFDGGK